MELFEGGGRDVEVRRERKFERRVGGEGENFRESELKGRRMRRMRRMRRRGGSVRTTFLMQSRECRENVERLSRECREIVVRLS